MILHDCGAHSMLSFTPFANPAMEISGDCSSAWQSDPEALQLAPHKAGDIL